MAKIELPATGASLNTKKPATSAKTLAGVTVGMGALFLAAQYGRRMADYTEGRIDSAVGMGGSAGAWGDLY